jgi:hypothetical protein
MKNENKSKIQINISQDDSENNDFLYCWHMFDNMPNKIKKYIIVFLKNEFIQVIEEHIINKIHLLK